MGGALVHVQKLVANGVVRSGLIPLGISIGVSTKIALSGYVISI